MMWPHRNIFYIICLNKNGDEKPSPGIVPGEGTLIPNFTVKSI